jgi:formate transporter
MAIIFPITAFVAAGFEHSVANMYFIPMGMLVKQMGDPALWTFIPEISQHIESLTWSNYIFKNLIPVTIGNIIGGSGFVGIAYWLIYSSKWSNNK